MEFSTLKRQIQKVIEFADPSELEVNSFATGMVKGQVDELNFRRPVYVFIGAEYLVVDAPFALLDEVNLPIDYAGLWGLGQVNGKLTFHNVFLLESLDSSFAEFTSALTLMVTEAAKNEFSITGKRMFIEDDTAGHRHDESDDSIQVVCDDCGQKFAEDEINYYEPESEGEEWLALCEKCSIA